MELPKKYSNSKKMECHLNLDHLGGSYPYYNVSEMKSNLQMEIYHTITSLPIEERKLDKVAIVEMVSKGYLLGDRTLIEGLNRVPWMGKAYSNEGWSYFDIPKHGKLKLDSDSIVLKLKTELKKEAINYLKGKRVAGILLSGGLDSRIVAGILRELQLDKIFNGDVVALTWGLRGTRDVVYAKEIAKRYKWEWEHIEIGPETVLKNIYITGKYGAEFSPVHLHALDYIKNMKGIDVILAGSYGDSVGRAEFSGKHVLNLKSTIPRELNKYGLLKDAVLKECNSSVLEDALGYRRKIKREKEYQYLEIEQQMHYMRRMLQSCMNYITQSIPMYQLFTSPGTFGLMWSLDPKWRDNRYYQILLRTLPGNVHDIPWSRTGKKLGEIDSLPDSLSKSHHQYGLWLRRELKDEILNLVYSDAIMGLGIFNEKVMEYLLKVWPKSNTTSINSIDSTISWLASLSVFIKSYNLVNSPLELKNNWKDGINTLYGRTNIWLYQTIRSKIRS